MSSKVYEHCLVGMPYKDFLTAFIYVDFSLKTAYDEAYDTIVSTATLLHRVAYSDFDVFQAAGLKDNLASGLADTPDNIDEREAPPRPPPPPKLTEGAEEEEEEVGVEAIPIRRGR